MILPDFVTINLDALGSAWLSFVELNYVEPLAGGSMFDPGRKADLNEAVRSFTRYVSDNYDDEQEIRHAMAWVLNLPESHFEDTLRKLKIPFQYNNPADAHRFLELLWERTWGDWRVEGFDAGEYDVEPERLAPSREK
ncbi:MAG TPA: hypothetical protein VGE45_15320 [Chloroflexia bacterium]|jgi:hypothetical protein